MPAIATTGPNTEETSVLLRLDGVQASYGQVEVLRDVSLNIRLGEIVCLIGNNGAGKTTTIRCINGQLQPHHGTVTLAGTKIVGARPAAIVALGIATVPEGRRIFAGLTVRENLLLGGYHRRKTIAIDNEIEKAFTMFPRLRERQAQLGGTLSGGEQQMLAIARALISNPKLLLLDEPSMGLSPSLQDEVFATIATLARSGCTVLLVEQNAEAALDIADRAYVMERGAIKLSGAASQLIDDPEIRSAYLGLH